LASKGGGLKDIIILIRDNKSKFAILKMFYFLSERSEKVYHILYCRLSLKYIIDKVFIV